MRYYFVPETLGFSSDILISGLNNLNLSYLLVLSTIESGVLENINVNACFLQFTLTGYLQRFNLNHYFADFQLKSADTTLFSGDVTSYPVGFFSIF